MHTVQELTEEGIPFMILFHEKDDTETPDKFRLQVARELVGEKSKYQHSVMKHTSI